MADKYKSIHLNVSRSKYSELIKWVEEKADEEGRTLNSFIIRLLLKEFEKDEEENNR